MVAIKERLLFESINVRGAALHKEKNHALGFRGEMGWLDCKRVNNRSFGLVCKQASKGYRAKSDRRLPERFSSTGVVHNSFPN